MNVRCVNGVVDGPKSSGFVESRFERFYIVVMSSSISDWSHLGASVLTSTM